MPVTDQHVAQLLAGSNVERHAWDGHARMIGTVMNERRIAPSEVLAVSRSNSSFAIVCRPFVAVATMRGVFNKRVEIEKVVPSEDIAAVVTDENGYKDRREYSLQANGSDSRSLLRLTWEGWFGEFGGTPASAAEGERDRVARVLLQVCRGG